MAIDASGVWPAPAACRRGTVTAYRFRLREERKRVIRLSSEKYRTIDDHETGLRRFVLIKNTLRRLQREAREEKLARHRAVGAGASLSYLSASRGPRSPSPPCDSQMNEALSTYGQPTPALTALEDEDLPVAKRPRLFMDDDKENAAVEGDICEDGKEEARAMVVDDTHEILRDLDLYETLAGDALPTPRPSTPAPPPPRPDTPYASPASTAPATSTASTTTTTYGGAGGGSYYEWSRPPQQQQYACGHASLLGNDLQSVVFHSLIASLES